VEHVRDSRTKNGINLPKRERKQNNMGRKKKEVVEEFEDLERDEPKYSKQQLSFIVPVPPSVNHMYQSAGRGRRLTKEATMYIKTAQEQCKKAIKENGWKKDREHVWYIMDLYYYFPDKKVRDSHNTLKILTDAFEGLLFPNDYFVLPRIQYVTLDRANPRLEIIFYPQTP
jgi:crossover junction endodeoxyribonuclease RusA